jgi:2,3-bisphosphoglycerate-dependent phosphoglycerate mutase|tara:strand:- start:935 stop:1660 length:726 start_codon:yes stop_codon:yes gene_type:complete
MAPKIRKNFQFLLVRHGESIWNKQNRFTGWTDIPLTKNGELQAENMGEILLRNKIKPHCIFTSNLERAIKTSEIIKNKLNNNFEIYESWRLNEKSYGDCEGICRDDLIKLMSKDYVSELRRSFFMLPPNLENDMKHNLYDYQLKTCKHYYEHNLQNGETKEMVLHRLLPHWYEAIIPKIKYHTCPLIVTHKHTARVLVKYLTQMPLKEFDNLDFPNSKIHHIKLNNEFFVDNLETDINILE